MTAAPPGPSPPPPTARAWPAAAALYAAAALATVAILFAGLRLDRADPHAPFAYADDALLILPFVKEVVETGTHWHTDRLGAPGTQHLHDFPVVDHLHFLVIWAMGRAFPDPVVVFNLYYLLTYPLTTLTALYGLRRVGVSPPAAFACALLYSFQPYHYLRGQVHYFLSAYYVVPLLLVVALEVCRGRAPFFPADAAGARRFRLRDRAALFPVAVGVATASAGAYYAFFSCFFLLAAGVYGAAAAKTWRVAAGAGIVLGLVVLGGLVNHAPAFARQAADGQNPRPRERGPEEAELYGLKVAQLVLPVAGHNPVSVGPAVLVDLASVRAEYQAPNAKPVNESDWDALGLVGAAGYVGLLVCVCLPAARRWPAGPLVALTAAGTLVGTVGGFGAVFNLFVTPQVRCYNRVSIFLAFLALAAVGFALDWLGRRALVRAPAAGPLAWPAALALVAFGVWDQTNDTWFPDVRDAGALQSTAEGARLAARRRFLQDREFFTAVESRLPAGAMVFTYPFVEYPESRPFREYKASGETDAYDHVVGYLHTRTLRWSFGAMKGREWDAWMRTVAGRARLDTPRFAERLVLAGFDGVLVDARGMNPEHLKAVQDGLRQFVGGDPPLRHPERKLFFYDLTGYRRHLLAAYGPAGFDARARAEHESLVVLWPKGFWSYEATGYEDRLHWGAKDAELALVNRSPRPVTVALRMRFRTTFKGPAALRVTSALVQPGGGPVDDALDVRGDDRPAEYARTVVVPPGRHPVRFRCTPETPVLPTDSRRVLFTVRDFRADPSPPSPEAP